MSSNSLHSKLNRFQGTILGNSPKPVVQDVPIRYRQMAKAVDGRIVSGCAGSFCLVKTHYSHHHSYGHLSLGDIPGDGSLPVSVFTRDDEPGCIEPASLLFIDTETTGLGGAGTVAFLVGCGSIVADGFEVRQYLIPDYSDEAAMLEALLSEFDNSKAIVSYNGAAFDLPLLQDRMIINRVARELDMNRHFDLLHPVRRLFRRRLGDCRLVNVEKELFGFQRDSDLPGYLIPSVYFNWLAEQDPELMGKVLEHNRLDIVSLYFLAGYIAQAFQTEGGIFKTTDDLYSLSRIYGWRKQNHRVVDLYYRIDATENKSSASDVLLFHARAFKRIGDYEKAVALWKRLSSSSSREGFWANVELAMYYEHRIKDVEKAYQYAQKANETASLSRRQRELLNKRLLRLHSKLSR
jgi:uncharacterized protein YprB with RNaseH-like and TPR domain